MYMPPPYLNPPPSAEHDVNDKAETATVDDVMYMPPPLLKPELPSDMHDVSDEAETVTVDELMYMPPPYLNPPPSVYAVHDVR